MSSEAGVLSWLVKKSIKEGAESAGEYAIRKSSKSFVTEGAEYITRYAVRRGSKELLKEGGVLARRVLYRRQLAALSKLSSTELEAAENILKRSNRIAPSGIEQLNKAPPFRINRIMSGFEGYNSAMVNKSYIDSIKRPSYKEGQVDDVWENARQPDGHIYDPNTGERLVWDKSKPRTGQWDMGHVPGKEYRKLHQDYLDGKISHEEFLREYNNPNNYRPEAPSSNRSHRFEENE